MSTTSSDLPVAEGGLAILTEAPPKRTRWDEAELAKRREREAQQLANLTGWDIDDIRAKIPAVAYNPPETPDPWWKRLWNQADSD